jgi:hypothetical protein
MRQFFAQFYFGYYFTNEKRKAILGCAREISLK